MQLTHLPKPGGAKDQRSGIPPRSSGSAQRRTPNPDSPGTRPAPGPRSGIIGRPGPQHPAARGQTIPRLRPGGRLHSVPVPLTSPAPRARSGTPALHSTSRKTKSNQDQNRGEPGTTPGPGKTRPRFQVPHTPPASTRKSKPFSAHHDGKTRGPDRHRHQEQANSARLTRGHQSRAGKRTRWPGPAPYRPLTSGSRRPPTPTTSKQSEREAPAPPANQ
jgi:hypothetical protein